MHTKELYLAGVMVVLMLVTVPGTGRGLTVPDTVILNSQSKLYESFKFDHAKHIQFMKECSYCHHHTTGTLVHDPNCARCHRNSSETGIVSCKGCHLTDPFSAAAIKGKDPKTYHHDKPSLKAAMHRNCIDCHEKMKGPTGCQDCHQRTKEGEAFYNSGAFAPRNKAAKGGHGGH
ncbi:MAG: cytochrome c3 family protein [Desulfuromonadaceae bacterium]